MLIPYSTDAPVYHYPIATGGLIVVNSFASVALWMYTEPLIPFILHYGQWNPVQWVTSAFLHADPMHLIMNMVFLWVFGLIVEGKIGWRRTLAAFLGIAVVQSGVEQTLMLGADEGGSLGASSAVYGFMAIALVWAPENEVSCWLLLVRYVHSFDIKIWVLGALYMGLDLIMLVFIEGFAMGTSLLHLMGAGLGLAVGVAMVRRRWVDCENWDVFSVWQGRNAMTREQLIEAELNSPESQEKLGRRREESLREIRALVAEGNPQLAYAAHEHCTRSLRGWTLADKDLLQIIVAFHAKKLWRESIPAMSEYVRRPDPPQAPLVRLKLAQVLLDHDQRPAQAMRVLAKIPPGTLPEKQEQARLRLLHRAEQLHAADPYEVAQEDW
ncbi:MAG: rhomboid family intramembrane serine protease [Planctomycetes bacterium]|nr:rhomboid family intramembrane serine protease [Planctomycetota bacterium]